MYCLKEAVVLAYNQLTQFLNRSDYRHVNGTSGLWTHDTRQIAFCLCVIDIGLKYHNQNDLQHFISTISQHYDYHIDTTSQNYIGFKLKWNYKEKYVDLTMPSYIPNLLLRLQHDKPTKPQ